MKSVRKPIAAVAEMLIRKPAPMVFNAFINPEITTKFWFTKSSGKLVEGKKFTWTWEMYNISASVTVKKIEKNKRLIIEWPYEGAPTMVEWAFSPFGKKATFVSIRHYGFKGTQASIIEQALGSTGGFTWVLAGLKAYLEHHIELNLIADRFPKGK
ncbi:MAG: Activator of Hsp90 ATPase 1 family protein [Chitinophagaceae bacterium]|nr:Activator of Hsp90 ATPase 1 family protein [Chitinophagaceae bacterium]